MSTLQVISVISNMSIFTVNIFMSVVKVMWAFNVVSVKCDYSVLRILVLFPL